jgi:starch phosphorylase
VFAGKAHPRDDGGKRLLQHIHRVSRQPQFLGKILLLEGYDVEVGRHLTSGVDVWLNNPRRPLEASGTSGQKVVLNGGLNCSILDGWWSEAFDGENGFAIGRGLTHRHAEEQDRRDFMDMKKALGEVAQVFYAGDGAWIRRVKRSMTTLAWRFCSDRMVQDYARLSYMPAAGVVPADLPA